MRTDPRRISDKFKFNISNNHFYEVAKEGRRRCRRVRQTLGEQVYPA